MQPAEIYNLQELLQGVVQQLVAAMGVSNPLSKLVAGQSCTCVNALASSTQSAKDMQWQQEL